MFKYLNQFLTEFDQLAGEGIVGHYNAFELIEIVGFKTKNKPFNILTIAVATEGLEKTDPTFLCKPIHIKEFEEITFGIRKSILTIKELRNALEFWRDSSNWKPVDSENHVGKLIPMNRQFVPSNLLNEITLNRILKNNFFNGSYILELFDSSKEHVKMLLNAPDALASLSEAVNEVISIDIASISDRLGNIILQFPIEVIRATFGICESKKNVEIAWHEKSNPRNLITIGTVYHDQIPVAFGCVELSDGIAELCEDTDFGLLHGYVWDIENKLLLAATDACTFLRHMSMNMQLKQPEPRIFPISFEENAEKARVQLIASPCTSQIMGNFDNQIIANPIQSRIYDEERNELARQRTFVQYGTNDHEKSNDRQRALEDIRMLISRHGSTGVWLWDPYLSDKDILDTLFWNQNAESSMRALTLLKQNDLSRDKLKNKYYCQLSNLNSNFQDIKIEFRSAHGTQSCDFHDRFLIFPAQDSIRAQAWSLGTSINNLGKAHHILQKVDNAQLVATAFEALWNIASEPKNLIWKHP